MGVLGILFGGVFLGYLGRDIFFFLGSMWSSRFLWRVVQRTACI